MYWLEFTVIYVISTVIAKAGIIEKLQIFFHRIFWFTVLNADSLEHSPFQTFLD